MDPLGRITTFSYDNASAVELRIDARGNRTTYTTDALGRVVRGLYPNDSRATFAFDQVGNRVQMRDTTGDYEFAYDGMNQMESVSEPEGSPITYIYDLAGQRSQMAKVATTITMRLDKSSRQ